MYRSDISDMCRDMQEYPQKLKENLQKNVQNPHRGSEAPPPAEGGVCGFCSFFDFPYAVCGFPAYLPVYICAYVYVYRRDTQFGAGQQKCSRNTQIWTVPGPEFRTTELYT